MWIYNLGVARLNPGLATYLTLRFGHEIISRAILSLPMSQVGQLSVTGKNGHLELVNCLGNLPKNSVDSLAQKV